MRWVIFIVMLLLAGFETSPSELAEPSGKTPLRLSFVQAPEGNAELVVRSLEEPALRRIASSVNGAASTCNGNLIYTTATNQTSRLMSSNLATDHIITLVDDPQAVLSQVACHPHEEQFLYLRSSKTGTEREPSIWQVSQRLPQPQRLPSSGSSAALNQQWSPDGQWLIYELASEARLVVQDSTGASRSLGFTGTFTWLPDSSALVIAELTDPTAGRFGRLVRYSLATQQTHLVLQSDDADVYYPRAAPDGRQLAYIRRPLGADTGELWVLDLYETNQARQLSNDPQYDNFDPQWSPDSSQLLWSRLNPKLSRYSIWLSMLGEQTSKLIADDAIWPRWIP
jgi:hypothetical protein